MLRIATLGLVMLAVCTHAGLAADFPNRPIRLLVPYAPGGAGDILARLIGKELSLRLKQSVIVDNRGGGGGMIAAGVVAHSPPDGYTLFLGGNGVFAIAPAVHSEQHFDTQAAFDPISLVAATPFILVVRPSLKVSNVAGLLALLRERPGQLNYGSSGIGATDHLSGVLFTRMSGTQATHVPYKGAALALDDLIAGRLDFEFASPLPAMPLIASGQLQAVALTSSSGSAALGKYPTISDTGVPKYDVLDWYGMVAPHGTPAAIREQVSAAVADSLADPHVRDFLVQRGLDPKGTTPAAFGTYLAQEIVRWGEIVKSAGIATSF